MASTSLPTWTGATIMASSLCHLATHLGIQANSGPGTAGRCLVHEAENPDKKGMTLDDVEGLPRPREGHSEQNLRVSREDILLQGSASSRLVLQPARGLQTPSPQGLLLRSLRETPRVTEPVTLGWRRHLQL